MSIGFEFTVDCAKVHRNLANFKFGSTEIDIENIKSAGQLLGGMFIQFKSSKEIVMSYKNVGD